MGRGRVRGGGGGRWKGRGGGGRWRGGGGKGRGIPVSEMVSAPYTNSVCVGIEVSCKQS